MFVMRLASSVDLRAAARESSNFWFTYRPRLSPGGSDALASSGKRKFSALG
jgi:hypothetical protein